jgi:hypothetical protein
VLALTVGEPPKPAAPIMKSGISLRPPARMYPAATATSPSSDTPDSATDVISHGFMNGRPA